MSVELCPECGTVIEPGTGHTQHDDTCMEVASGVVGECDCRYLTSPVDVCESCCRLCQRQPKSLFREALDLLERAHSLPLMHGNSLHNDIGRFLEQTKVSS